MSFVQNLDRYMEGGESMYGSSALCEYLAGRRCCAVHWGVDDVLGDQGRFFPGVEAGHPVLRAVSEGVDVKCGADARTLELDRSFCRAALLFEVPGFSYLHPKILSSVRRWATGTVLGLAAFGRGYCYLAFFHPPLRFRVARILGPAPLVADVLAMFRLGGMSQVYVEVDSVGQGLYHCKQSCRMLTGSQVNAYLLDLVARNPGARIGIEPLRGHCSECGFTVALDGHESRCRIQRVRMPAEELLGDALHALDVKRCLVLALPAGSKYTEVSKDYMSATAQRDYLQAVDPSACDFRASDRVWSAEFEARYSGVFRDEYLQWLVRTVTAKHRYSWAQGVAAMVSKLQGLDPPVLHGCSKFRAYEVFAAGLLGFSAGVLAVRLISRSAI